MINGWSKQPFAYFGRFLGSLTDKIVRPNSGPIDPDAWRPLRLGASHVIRTVALGIACLAGLGAIAAAAKKSHRRRNRPGSIFLWWTATRLIACNL
jgi:hypothetical protein